MVQPEISSTQLKVHSVLARSLKVRVPALVPPGRCGGIQPRSRLMSAAVGDFVAAGVLRLGRPLACCKLFAVPKSATVARLVYHLSVLTPQLPCGPCSLPSVESALELSFRGYIFLLCLRLSRRRSCSSHKAGVRQASHHGLNDFFNFLISRCPRAQASCCWWRCHCAGSPVGPAQFVHIHTHTLVTTYIVRVCRCCCRPWCWCKAYYPCRVRVFTKSRLACQIGAS